MNKGIVILAHNNRKVDYAKMSIISAKFARKNLDVPVTMLTDNSTIDWMKESGIWKHADSVFENIISVDRPETDNQRILYDGTLSEKIPFLNSNRSTVWEYSPYEKTLLIDSDYIINSNLLSYYWNISEEVLIAEKLIDIQGDRIGVLDKWTSETGVHLYWATAVMFTKNEHSKMFFQLVDYIRENYKFYADLFRFNPDQYRNDITFSIAKHILDGFEKTSVSLPPILTIQGKDILEKINDDGKMIFSIKDSKDEESFYLTSIKNQDVHIMNKQSILRHYDRLVTI